MKVLTTALNAIGHPEAQSALAAAVLARPSDEKALFKLLFALSTVERPTPEAERALRTLMEKTPDPNVVVMARLSLGSMARRLAETAPDRAADIVAEFCRGLASARTSDAKKSYLLALGNAGSAAALPAVRPFIGDANADLRAAAVRSLRFVTTAEAEGVILRALSSDPEAEVRAQAVEALADRDMTPEAFAAEKSAVPERCVGPGPVGAPEESLESPRPIPRGSQSCRRGRAERHEQGRPRGGRRAAQERLTAGSRRKGALRQAGPRGFEPRSDG